MFFFVLIINIVKQTNRFIVKMNFTRLLVPYVSVTAVILSVT